MNHQQKIIKTKSVKWVYPMSGGSYHVKDVYCEDCSVKRCYDDMLPTGQFIPNVKVNTSDISFDYSYQDY